MDNSKKKDFVKTPHDYFMRSLMERKKFAIGFIESYLPSWITADLELEGLENCQTHFIKDSFDEVVCDVLCKIPMKAGGDVFMYVLVEHQSTENKKMPLRMWEYMMQVMTRYYDSKSNKCPLVLPVVLYHGRGIYSETKELTELIDGPREMIEYGLGKLAPFQLIDTNLIDDEVLREATRTNLMLYTLKHIYAKDFLLKIENIMGLLRDISVSMEKDESVKVLESLLNYFANARRIQDPKEFVAVMKKSVKNEEQERMMMTVAEHWFQDGVKKGIEQGAQQGMQQGQQQGQKKAERRIALNLLRDGLPPSKVSEMTGYPIGEILEMSED